MRIEVGVVAGVAALTLAACSGSTGPANTGRLSLQLSSAGQAVSAAPAAVADELIITDVQVVARRIRLERAPGTCPADSTAGASSASGEGEHEEHTSECADVRLDPMVLEPPVDSSAHTLISVDLPEGTYREVKVQIHKLTDAPADSALRAASPGLSNASVLVTGSFNGTDFTFTSGLTSEAEIELPTPVEVTAGQPAAVTLAIDLGSWFRGASGELLNPIDPSQQIRSRIEQNIRRSFHAFEDQDHDGHPDH